MASIVYHKVGPRKWLQQTFADQCDFDMVIPRGRCQGVKGHSGDHWMYGQDGSYCWAVNKKEKKVGKFNIASGWTPPGNPGYIDPVDKISEKHTACNETVEVIDDELIDRLENDQDSFGDNVSFTMPVDDEDMDMVIDDDGTTLRDSIEGLDEKVEDHVEEIDEEIKRNDVAEQRFWGDAFDETDED